MVIKGINLYLHKVFKESDEISAKQEMEEEELEEIATNTAKAPSSDSITVCSLHVVFYFLLTYS